MSEDALADLLEAIEEGDSALAASALERDPELANAVLPESIPVTLAAAYGGSHEVARMLIERRGARATFSEVVALGNATRVHRALERDADLVRARSPDGWSPLHLAAFLGHEEVLRLLLASGADVDDVSVNGWANTPLASALVGGHPELATVLLEEGADPDSRDAARRTPLHVAALYESPAAVVALLDAGATPFVLDREKRTPLDVAREAENDRTLAALAQRAGAH